MIVEDYLKDRNRTRVLFFGRSGCELTEKAFKYLEVLGCEVTYVNSQRRGEELSEEILSWTGDYIFCFRSMFVLPKYLIDRAKIAAVNFHPASPEYPGSGCLNFALYDEAKEYGVTAHIMNEQIDNGPILLCRRFAVLPLDSVHSLLTRTHLKLIDLFFEVVTELVSGGKEALVRMIQSSAVEKWQGVVVK